jgi:hypothetical protein
MAATAIDANGIVTVSDTGTLADGDVVTITGVTGTIRDTTNGTGGIAIQKQSYFIQIQSATTFKLVRNYNEVNSRKPATFINAATAATVNYINVSNVLQVLGSVYAQLDPADRIQEDFNLQIPLHIGYAYAQAQANKALNVINAFTDMKKMDYLGLPLQIDEPLAGKHHTGCPVVKPVPGCRSSGRCIRTIHRLHEALHQR